MKYKQYVSDNRESIIEFLKTDSLMEYCSQNNISYHSVYNWCKKLGIEIKNIQSENSRKRLSDKHISIDECHLDDIKKMYFDNNMSFSTIGKQYGVGAVTVHNFFKRHGIKARSREEGSRLVEWTPEKREEYRQRGYEIYLNQRCTGTKPERDFIEWCVCNNIMFIEQWRQVKGTNHPYDFLLPEYNLIVEIDGHYWHSMKKQKEKDKKHVDFAIKSGYNIVRICTKQLEKVGNDYMVFLGEYINEI